MNATHTLFLVDDDEESRHLAELMFGKEYDIQSFESARACLDRLETQLPSLFLLDVNMPEIDGYELCREIRAHPACRGIPIVFTSGLLDLDSHLAGYEAGGDDFVVKPLNFPELRQKIEVLLRRYGQERSLQSQIADSETLTSLILSNLDEYAIQVKFLRALNGCEQYKDIGEAIFAMLDAYHLDGVVQFRLESFELTINKAGEVTPIQSSILGQIRSMGSIVSYKNRAAFNYEQLSLMINNMPVDDPELCGRLRDHLAIAVETAASKVLTIAIRQKNEATRNEITAVLADLRESITQFREIYENARQQGSLTTALLMNDLDSEFANLGMREIQEESIKQLVLAKTNELVELFDLSATTEDTLNALTKRLGYVL